MGEYKCNFDNIKVNLIHLDKFNLLAIVDNSLCSHQGIEASSFDKFYFT